MKIKFSMLKIIFQSFPKLGGHYFGRSVIREDIFVFFQLFSNFAFPYRSETSKNEFSVKFRIDIGLEDL